MALPGILAFEKAVEVTVLTTATILAAKAASEGSKEKQTIGDGKPTKETGFEPKRNSDGKKVVAPNGKRGYVDKKGDIWVPVKKSNHEGAHRGEHWDVQHPREKTYHNTLPDGRIAGGSCRHVKK
ncbi:hypothetical protein RclHR1_07870004 [Rhizophagus clarus]|nr:hypothetical protein RclHR1_07870004 [Rhizophagus clarus]